MEQGAPLKGLIEPLPPVVPLCADGYPDEVGEGWVEELCRSYHWKTTSKEASKQGCLQVSEVRLMSCYYVVTLFILSRILVTGSYEMSLKVTDSSQ